MPSFRKALDALNRLPDFIPEFLPQPHTLRIVITNCFFRRK
jgi:hypothetical protein